MPTHTISVQYSGGSTAAVQSRQSYTAGAENNIEEELDAGTDQLLAFTADVSQMKSCVLMADVDMTVKTNSSGSPAKTIALVGGQAVIWSSTNGQTNPFGTTDVTALYVTNTEAGTLTIRTLIDPTV